ncbi:AAA family ATPase [Acerihabitans arboris]|uniref:AAA family ATPase n=1 Tax=Acerihabitans arboris TaxID=2691583 RepID=A0A845SN81_9GAMM|nr:AAA family ATPase [Acerihabitans arboris]NDL64384.1 AAA family ATPase [Acerihabitans arboris]
MINLLAVSGYRSLRNLVLELGQITVITGPNGAGKSSIYRALNLLADIAQDRIVQSLAADGGLASTLWAGPETFSRAIITGSVPLQRPHARQAPVSLRLGFAGDDYGYAIDLGLPERVPPSASMFSRDPHIKSEVVWHGPLYGKSAALADRHGPAVRVRDERGVWQKPFHNLAPFDSMMTHCIDPQNAPELLMLRETMRGWRFYDHLRTDRDAPARRPQIGTYTPVLAADGANLAAAVQTIYEIGFGEDLDETIHDAFPGAALHVAQNDGYLELRMSQHGLLRALKAAELSDGTLRFLLLAAALHSPRPPALMILNEPETSLHPELLPALARLVGNAARRTQMVIVSHAVDLVDELRSASAITPAVLEKRLGETLIKDDDAPVWHWPAR